MFGIVRLAYCMCLCFLMFMYIYVLMLRDLIFEFNVSRDRVLYIYIALHFDPLFLLHLRDPHTYWRVRKSRIVTLFS